MRPLNTRSIVAVVLAMSMVLVAAVNLMQAEAGITREMHLVDGVPIEIFAPASAAQTVVPAVVVAHGFSGSRQLMYGFAYTLARNGYLAALMEFAGHGSNTIPLQQDEHDSTQLLQNLQIAIDYVRTVRSVDAKRVAILGHSMGAGIVTQYGSVHPDVPATIAISLGGANTAALERTDAPRNLLVLVGQNEFASIKTGSLSALRGAYPDGQPDVVYGDTANGSARKLVIVPVVEHISILFSQVTYREVITWLDAAFGVDAFEVAPYLDDRMGWIGLLYLGAALGFYPLSVLILRTQEKQTLTYAPSRPWIVIGINVVAGIAAPLLMQVIPIAWIPLTVGNYVAVYFALAGLMLSAYLWLIQRRLYVDVNSLKKNAAPALVLAIYALVSFGIPAHLALVNFTLTPTRLLVLPLIVACLFVFFTADEALLARPSRSQRVWLYVITRLVVLASLIGAIFVLRAPFFVALLLPVFALMFLWHGVYGYWIHGRVSAPWVSGLLNALVYGWFVSAVFAVVG